MEKDFELIELFELYQGLLTDKQRELFSSYYLYDLSLSEIAEPFGTTRQSVYEGVKKVKKKLIELENILHLRQRNVELTSLANSFKDKNLEICDKILEIIGR